MIHGLFRASRSHNPACHGVRLLTLESYYDIDRKKWPEWPGKRRTFMDITNYHIEKGHGEPFILLHGNGEDCSYFQGQIDEFSKTYHVYAIDTRGHGKTPRGTKPFTIRQFAEDLKCFMDDHQIEKAHILGFSDGGNIAMIFALRYPERVDRLILNGANLNPKGVRRITQIPIEIGYRIARRFSDKSASARQNAEMLGLMVNDPNVDPEELASLKPKTLVIAGTKDMIREEHTRLIASCIPDAELAFIEGDHFIANKRPDEFNRVVLQFLRRRMELKKIMYELTVCKVADISEIDMTADFYFVGKTDEELSLVCKTQDTPSKTIERDDGWRGFRIQGVLDFSLIGILSELSGILAQHRIGIFAVSTYNTDYILVKEENFERALNILNSEGYTVI